MTRKMQFCFMITHDIITSESDINVYMSNGFTTAFSKYRTQEQKLCFFDILQFLPVLIDKNYVPFSLSLSSLCFQIMVLKTPTKHNQ